MLARVRARMAESVGCLGGVGDGPQGGQGSLDGGRRLIPHKSSLEEGSGGVPVLQAEQVGGGGQACPDDGVSGFAAFLLPCLVGDLLPGGGEFGVGGGLDLPGAVARMAWAMPGCIR